MVLWKELKGRDGRVCRGVVEELIMEDEMGCCCLPRSGPSSSQSRFLLSR